MVKTVKIFDLPASTELPNDGELIVPVFLDNTDRVLKSISIDMIVDRIRKVVLEGNDIEVVAVEGGIKFKKSNQNG